MLKVFIDDWVCGGNGGGCIPERGWMQVVGLDIIGNIKYEFVKT